MNDDIITSISKDLKLDVLKNDLSIDENSALTFISHITVMFLIIISFSTISDLSDKTLKYQISSFYRSE